MKNFAQFNALHLKGIRLLNAQCFSILKFMNLAQIPKVELHRHLEGALRLSTLHELGRQLKIELPQDEAGLRAKLLVTEPMKDLESVLSKFWLPQSMLASEEILERITYEACEDALNEGIRILELRYAPTFVIANHSQFTFEKIHRGIAKGIERAQRELKMAVGLIAIIQRILPLKDAERVTDFAIDHKDHYMALDLADNEVGFDCKPFAPMFMKAKKAGLHVTIHAGEANYPGAPQAVIDSIEILGAERIGHGLQIIKDAGAMDLVKKKKVILELCPYSNWLVNAIPNVKEHPFRRLMEKGVLTTINSDDPGVFGSSILTDYEILQKHHQFSDADFNRCNDIAAAASFIPESQKQKFWPRKIQAL